MLLRAPDSLVVSIIKGEGLDTEEQPNIAPVPTTPRKSRGHGFGIDGLDLLKFTYKVFYKYMSSIFLFKRSSIISVLHILHLAGSLAT